MEVEEFIKKLEENGFKRIYRHKEEYIYNELVTIIQDGLRLIIEEIDIKKEKKYAVLIKEENYHYNTVGYLDISKIKSLRFEPTMTGKIMVIEWN